VKIREHEKNHPDLLLKKNKEEWDKEKENFLTEERRRTRYEVFTTGLPAVLTGDDGYLAGINYRRLDKRRKNTDVELRHLILGLLAVA
jgi:hypothetical protein